MGFNGQRGWTFVKEKTPSQRIPLFAKIHKKLTHFSSPQKMCYITHHSLLFQE